MRSKNILEIKVLGKEIFFFIIIFISGLLTYYYFMRKTSIATVSFMFFSEYCLTFLAGIIGVINTKELVEDDIGEILFTIKYIKRKLGINRQLRFMICYSVLLGIYVCISSLIFKEVIFGNVLLQLIFQSLFMNSLGFFLVVVFKNSGLALAGIGLYSVVYYFLYFIIGNTYINFLNIYVRGYFGLSTGETMLLIVKCLIYSICFYICGQINIKR